jgi:hypothetical protein
MGRIGLERRNMFRVILFSLLSLTAFVANAEELWSWVRVEAGIPNAVVMRGQGITVAKNQKEMILRLSADEKSFDKFLIKLHISGGRASASFEPPNTARVKLQVSGIHRETPAGDGSIYEEYILANTGNGNFIILSRFRLRKSK